MTCGGDAPWPRYSRRMTRPILYGIKNCDTVKRARGWLESHGIDYVFHDYKKDGVPLDHVAKWIDARGWEALVNRQGTTWRKLDDALKESVVDAASATAVMNEHSSVIRRPVVEWGDGRLTVGFKEAEFENAVSGAA